MTPQPSQECGCKIVGPAYDFRIAAIQYCPLHAKSEEMLELLKIIIRRMSLINGGDTKCVHNDSSICANHTIISVVNKLIAEIEGEMMVLLLNARDCLHGICNGRVPVGKDEKGISLLGGSICPCPCHHRQYTVTPDEGTSYCEQCERKAKERDAWKEDAERLAEALEACFKNDRSKAYEYGEGNRNGVKPEIGQRWLTPKEISKQALAAHNKMKDGK